MAKARKKSKAAKGPAKKKTAAKAKPAPKKGKAPAKKVKTAAKKAKTTAKKAKATKAAPPKTTAKAAPKPTKAAPKPTKAAPPKTTAKAAAPKAAKEKAPKVVKGKAAGTQPKVGAMAPTFSLPSTSGESIDLASFRGDKNVLLYFYPKDDTPGCTKQACTFQTGLADYEALDTVVLGVSPDSLSSHDKFRKKYGLSFDLVSDEANEVAQKYGVWVEKNMYGNVSMGIQRATFLIDKDGKIAASWPKVSVDGHHDEVLEKVRELEGGGEEAEDEDAEQAAAPAPAPARKVSPERTRGMTRGPARDAGGGDDDGDDDDRFGGSRGGGSRDDDDDNGDPYAPMGGGDDDDDLQ